MTLQGKDVLFIGIGSTAVCWYRCALPAMYLGADWMGVIGEPPHLAPVTGIVRGQTQMFNYLDYKVIVLQQPRGKGWFREIRRLQEQGIKVLFEIDDYVHSIRGMKDHDYRDYYTTPHLQDLELNMRVCDGLICSTEYIARRYRKFNQNTFVCRIGLDLIRYRLTPPERKSLTIGWAGATGHLKSVGPWLSSVAEIMAEYPHTCFVSIGQDYARPFADQFGPHRAISVPFTLIETYPCAMTLMDVALAPAGATAFFQGKSDLRWLEASALGIPTIANPNVYPEIEDRVTGFHAISGEHAKEALVELLNDSQLGKTVGEKAKEYVKQNRTIEKMVPQWADALTSVL